MNVLASLRINVVVYKCSWLCSCAYICTLIFMKLRSLCATSVIENLSKGRNVYMFFPLRKSETWFAWRTCIYFDLSIFIWLIYGLDDWLINVSFMSEFSILVMELRMEIHRRIEFNHSDEMKASMSIQNQWKTLGNIRTNRISNVCHFIVKYSVYNRKIHFLH